MTARETASESTTATRIALGLAASAAALGLLGLIGGPLGLPLLTQVRPSYRPIAPSAACALLLLGLILIRLLRGPRPGERAGLAAGAGLVVLYGVLDFVGSLGRVDLNGEEALTRHLARVWSVPLLPMSPVAAVFMSLIGAALLVLLYQPRAPRELGPRRLRSLAGGLGTVALGVALVFLLSYLYGVPLLYGSAALPIAATSALGFLFLGAAVVAATGPAHWPLREFAGPSVRARLLRAFLPLTVLTVVLTMTVHEQVPVFAQVNRALQSSLLAVLFAAIAGYMVSRVAAALGGVLERAQGALRESEVRFRGLFEAMLDGLFVVEAVTDAAGEPVDYRVVEVNPAWERMLHYRRQDVLGRLLSEAFPTVAAFWKGEFDEVLRRGEPREGEARSAAGKWLAFRAYAPRPGQVATIVRDVTERKQAEEAQEALLHQLDDQRALLQTIIENTGSAIGYYDAELTIRMVNQAYIDRVQLPREALLGRRYHEVLPSAEVEATLRRVVQTKQAMVFHEMPYVFTNQPARGVMYFNWLLVPLLNTEGEVEGIVSSSTDVTESVRQREQVLEAERARADVAERMTAEINHRMKNNLMLLASVLQLQLTAMPPESAAADAVRDAISRISSLSVVHEHLYQGNSGKVELRDVLRRVGEVCAHALSTQPVRFTLTGDPTFVSSKLGSTIAVLANELLTNAVKYGGPGEDGVRRIEAGVQRAGEELVLRVWNSGHPLPPDFVLGRHEGTGLELVQGVVLEQLHGSFSLRAQAGGTLAEVVFPASAVHSSYAAAEQATPPRPGQG